MTLNLALKLKTLSTNKVHLLLRYLIMLYGVKGLKKYLYISILFGAFALSGCTDEGTDSKEMAEEVGYSISEYSQIKTIDTFKQNIGIFGNLYDWLRSME